jgi:hypothetical protein
MKAGTESPSAVRPQSRSEKYLVREAVASAGPD